MSMRNPKRRREAEDEPNWSKLCRDVLQIVFERLSPTDFDRAKAVCSAWRSASRESLRKQNQTPWLILFPYERSYGYSCRLLNPAERRLMYRSRKLGVEFTQSRCVATCGSWLLMYVPHEPKLYILNPLTREIIDLPPLDSRRNDISLSPEDPHLRESFRASRRESALTTEISDLSDEKLLLWIDERSKDYLVVWSHNQCCLFFSRKQDSFWQMFPYISLGYRDLVYKPHMLYILTVHYTVDMFDFSGGSPLPLIIRPVPFYPSPPCLSPSYTKSIAVTTSGKALMVICYDIHKTSRSFYLYEMNPVSKTWDEVLSLGDQALIFDLRITVPAKDIQGIKSNSIYFSGLDHGTKHIFIFSLATRKVEPFVTSTSKFFDARWFIPNV